MNIRPIPTVLRTDVRPARPNDRTVEPVLYAGIVARRVAIVALLMLLVLPAIWSMITGQRAVIVAGATDASAIAVVAPQGGTPQVGDTVAIRTASAHSVSVGQVAKVSKGSIALQDPVRPGGWTAPVADLNGSVIAVFDGPVAQALIALPPFAMSAAIIVMIIVLVAIPLRRTDPHEGEVAVVPQVRHIKHFTDSTRA